MLKDVIEFVMARTNLNRDAAVREINYAWDEIWNSDDLPNSLQELSTTPIDSTSRISLPWYCGEIRGVKQNIGFGRSRIDLNTPRPWYQDATYAQSPFTWRMLGSSPLSKSITNATTLKLSFTEPVTEQVVATLMGPNDNGTQVREQLTFKVNETFKQSVNRFTDLTTCTKDIITLTDLSIINAANETIGIVPNCTFEARNTIWQIADKCFVQCNYCRCYDILFKLPAPYLYFDETPTPFQTVLMAKTMEWIMLPKDGQDQKAQMFGTKSRELLVQFNANERGIEKRIDVGLNMYNKVYAGYL